MSYDDEPMDDDGYPTQATLKRVREWPFEDAEALWVFLHCIWWNREWCWHRQRGRRLWVSTGGWSGNEDLIDALARNFIIWSQCFVQHRRGGHYIFSVPKQLVKRMPVIVGDTAKGPS